ncbi:MAG: AAA family ATPase [Deinococcota bacterium]
MQRLQSLRDVPLVAVIAPSGYGKTTLLAQHARSCTGPVAWLSLDAEAVDLTHFTQQVQQALQQALPELELHLDDEQRGEHLSAPMLAWALNATRQSVTLVLDNADIISDDGGRWLTRLVEHLHEGHQVLVGSYGVLALPLARLSAAGLAAVLSGDELRLTALEAQELTRLPEQDALRLVHELDGWPMAIALHRSTTHRFTSVGDLISELVGQVGEPLRSLLPELAACELWDEAFIHSTGLSLPPRWFDELRRSGLPITPLSGHSCLPHRELLRWLHRQLTLHPQRAQARYRQVAAAYQEAGQPVQAMHAFLQAGDQVAAEQSVAGWVRNCWRHSELRSVLAVLDRFGSLQDEQLRSAYAYALVDAGRFEEAGDVLPTLSDDIGFQRESAWMTMLFLQGRYTEALSRSETVARHRQSDEEGVYLAAMQVMLLVATERRDEAQVLAERLRRAAGMGFWMQVDLVSTFLYSLPLEDHPEYLRHAEALLQRVVPPGVDPSVRLGSLPITTTAYLLRGRPEEAPLARQADLPDRQVTEAAARDAWQGRGDLLIATGHLEEAGAAFERALHSSLNRQSDLEMRESLGGLTEVAFLRHESAQAGALLQQLLPPNHPEARALQGYLNGLHALAQGDRITARAMLRESAEADIFSLHRWKSWRLLRALGDHGSLRCPEPPPLPWLDRLVLRLTALYLPGGQSASPQEPSPSPVRMRVVTFGRLDVQVEDQAVHFPFAKAAELFAYLLTRGPTSRADLIDALWEGSGDPKHVDYFRVAVRRLRLALAEVSPGVSNPVPLIQGRYHLAAEYAVQSETDVVWQACASGTREQLEEAWRLQGTFLPKLESSWAADLRQELHDELIRASLGYAATQEKHDPEAATLAYQQVLKLDPASEQGYEGLIASHLARGERLLATHAFERYARMMQQEYGADPAPHIQRLLR